MKPIALTMGDPAGIGGELTLRAWQALHRDGPCFVALDDPEAPAAVGRRADRRESHRQKQRAPSSPPHFRCLPIKLAAAPRPGHPDKANAAAVIASIERAAALCLSGEVGGMVTNPINKAALYDAGFAYPGHTEFLAALTGAHGRQIMMLASPELRVVPVTVHASLRNSIAMLTTEAIVAAARTTAAALQRDFGIARPRLADRRAQPARRRAGRAGRRGDHDHRPGHRRTAQRRHRCLRSMAARHDVHRGRAHPLRRGDLHVS